MKDNVVMNPDGGDLACLGLGPCLGKAWPFFGACLESVAQCLLFELDLA